MWQIIQGRAERVHKRYTCSGRLGAYKVATIIKVSEELLADSYFNIENYVSDQFRRRIGDAEELAFFTGNGSGKPTGILHTTGGAEIGVTSAVSVAITADELIDLIYYLRSRGTVRLLARLQANEPSPCFLKDASD